MTRFTAATLGAIGLSGIASVAYGAPAEVEITVPGYIQQRAPASEGWVPVEALVVTPRSAWTRARLVELIDEALDLYGAERFSRRPLGDGRVFLGHEACAYVRQETVGLQELMTLGVDFDPERELCLTLLDDGVGYLVRGGGRSVFLLAGADLARRSPRPVRQEHWLYAPFQLADAVFRVGCTTDALGDEPLDPSYCRDLEDALGEAAGRLDRESVRY